MQHNGSAGSGYSRRPVFRPAESSTCGAAAFGAAIGGLMRDGAGRRPHSHCSGDGLVRAAAVSAGR